MAPPVDWYMRNLQTLVMVFLASIVLFVVLFASIYLQTRARFCASQGQPIEQPSPAASNSTTKANAKAIEAKPVFAMHEKPEVVLIKAHTKLVRLLGILGMVLQIILLNSLVPVSGAKGSIVFAFSLFRPASGLICYALCFMTNTHAFCRLVMLATGSGLVVLNTVSQVALSMVLDCLQHQQLHCGQGALSWFNLPQLQTLRRRDLVEIGLNVVLVLETGFLCVAIGFWKTRYSRRDLSVSRPRLNVRQALQHFFPALAAKTSAPLLQATLTPSHHKRHHWHQAPNQAKDLFAGVDQVLK